MTAILDDRAALLAGIRANPDEDLPRLVYADWLEERDGDDMCGQCGGSGDLSYPIKKGGPFDHLLPKPKYVVAPPEGKSPCSDCKGTGRISNGYAARAAFIRADIAYYRSDDRDCQGRQSRRRKGKQHHNGQCRCERCEAMRGANRLMAKGLPDPPIPSAVVAYGSERGFWELVQTGWNTWVAYRDRILADPNTVLRDVHLESPPDQEWIGRIIPADQIHVITDDRHVVREVMAKDICDALADMHADYSPGHPIRFHLSERGDV